MPGPDATPAEIAAPSIGWFLKRAARVLREAGLDDAGAEARRLAAAALGWSAAELLLRADQHLSPAQAARLEQFLARRRAREPLSRILGEREFYGRTFTISPATLDPRADSETLITAALEIVRTAGWQDRPLRILDVGTGSGCLLLTLLAELPDAMGVGTDVSGPALEVARQNATRLGLEGRTAWVITEALDGLAGPFDLLVSNPPYICTADIPQLESEVRDHDPHSALDGGVDGLAVYRRIATRIATMIPNGWSVFEVGHDQADAMAALLSPPAGPLDPASIRVHLDVSGKRRAVAGKTRTPECAEKALGFSPGPG
jgi:release factor glutamine methyltransferase